MNQTPWQRWDHARRDKILQQAKQLAAEQLADTTIIETDRDRLVLEAGMALGIHAALEHADDERNTAVAVERAAARINHAWAGSF